MVQIIIPMSGLGQRFINAGYDIPKPLIKVDGKPIIEHVVNLFPRENNIKFICNDKHLKETNMREILNYFCPQGKIYDVILDLSSFSVFKMNDYFNGKLRKVNCVKNNTPINYNSYYQYPEMVDIAPTLLMHLDIDRAKDMIIMNLDGMPVLMPPTGY